MAIEFKQSANNVAVSKQNVTDETAEMVAKATAIVARLAELEITFDEVQLPSKNTSQEPKVVSPSVALELATSAFTRSQYGYVKYVVYSVRDSAAIPVAEYLRPKVQKLLADVSSYRLFLDGQDYRDMIQLACNIGLDTSSLFKGQMWPSTIYPMAALDTYEDIREIVNGMIERAEKLVSATERITTADRKRREDHRAARRSNGNSSR